MSTPNGYRKALRLMRHADKFGFPIVTFIDTPGAYAGLKAEELGQGEAIAVNLREMFGLRVPIISVVIGEGGSGGALAIGCADRCLILEARPRPLLPHSRVAPPFVPPLAHPHPLLPSAGSLPPPRSPGPTPRFPHAGCLLAFAPPPTRPTPTRISIPPTRFSIPTKMT